MSVARCEKSNPTDTHIVLDNPASPTVFWRNAAFASTDRIEVTGTTPAVINCTIAVFDTDDNPAVTDGNPDPMDAHPPMGTIQIKLNGVPIGPPCPLQRAMTAPPPTVQGVGQAPFLSTCTRTNITLPIPSNPNTQLTFEYTNTPTPAAHAYSFFPIDTEFK
jgi:hypothetical protein